MLKPTWVFDRESRRPATGSAPDREARRKRLLARTLASAPEAGGGTPCLQPGPSRNRRRQFAVLVGLLGAVALPAYGAPPYGVDDPGTAQRGQVVVYINYAATWSNSERTEALPGLAVDYGLSNRTELNVASAVVRARGPDIVSGLGDTAVSLKHRFREEAASRPAMAVAYQVSLPTGNARRGLGSGSIDHAFWLTLGKTRGRAMLVANVGGNLCGSSGSCSNAFYGAVYDYEVARSLRMGLQLHGSTADGLARQDTLAAGLGMIYEFTPDRAVLFLIGRGLQGDARHNLFIGFQSEVVPGSRKKRGPK